MTNILEANNSEIFYKEIWLLFDGTKAKLLKLTKRDKHYFLF